MKRRLVLLALVVLPLASCGAAPLQQQYRLCPFVRQAVKEGSMPINLAEGLYPECKPFEVGGK